MRTGKKERELKKAASLLQGDKSFVERVLSRSSSVGAAVPGRSTRYYAGANAEVPFVWEEEPGKPKDPSLDHYVLAPMLLRQVSLTEADRPSSYFYEETGRVPFQWELQPGKPIEDLEYLTARRRRSDTPPPLPLPIREEYLTARRWSDTPPSPPIGEEYLTTRRRSNAPPSPPIEKEYLRRRSDTPPSPPIEKEYLRRRSDAPPSPTNGEKYLSTRRWSETPPSPPIGENYLTTRRRSDTPPSPTIGEKYLTTRRQSDTPSSPPIGENYLTTRRRSDTSPSPPIGKEYLRRRSETPSPSIGEKYLTTRQRSNTPSPPIRENYLITRRQSDTPPRRARVYSPCTDVEEEEGMRPRLHHLRKMKQSRPSPRAPPMLTLTIPNMCASPSGSARWVKDRFRRKLIKLSKKVRRVRSDPREGNGRFRVSVSDRLDRYYFSNSDEEYTLPSSGSSNSKSSSSVESPVGSCRTVGPLVHSSKFRILAKGLAKWVKL